MKKQYDYTNNSKDLEDLIFIKDKIVSFFYPLFLFVKDFSTFYKKTFILFLLSLILIPLYFAMPSIQMPNLSFPAKWFTTNKTIDVSQNTLILKSDINSKVKTNTSKPAEMPNKLKLNIMTSEMIPFEGGDYSLSETTKTAVDNLLSTLDTKKITNITLIGYAGLQSAVRNELADSRSGSVSEYIITSHNIPKTKVTVKSFNNNEHKLLESNVPRVKMIITYQ